MPIECELNFYSPIGLPHPGLCHAPLPEKIHRNTQRSRHCAWLTLHGVPRPLNRVHSLTQLVLYATDRCARRQTPHSAHPPEYAISACCAFHSQCGSFREGLPGRRQPRSAAAGVHSGDAQPCTDCVLCPRGTGGASASARPPVHADHVSVVCTEETKKGVLLPFDKVLPDYELGEHPHAIASRPLNHGACVDDCVSRCCAVQKLSSSTAARLPSGIWHASLATFGKTAQ
jgi:hypothetical protein